MLTQCLPTVCDAGPTLGQHWFSVSCWESTDAPTGIPPPMCNSKVTNGRVVMFNNVGNNCQRCCAGCNSKKLQRLAAYHVKQRQTSSRTAQEKKQSSL